MTETNRTQTLVATLRKALQDLESALGVTREGVDEIGKEARLLSSAAIASGLFPPNAADAHANWP